MTVEEEVVENAQLDESGVDTNEEIEGSNDAWDRISQMRNGDTQEDQEEDDLDEEVDQEESEEGAVEEEEPSDETEEEPVKEEPKDIWAEAPEELRTAYQQTAQNRDRLGGTVSGLQKKINALEAQLAQQKSALPKQANASGSGENKVDPNDPFAEMREYYPEVAAPVEMLISDVKQQNQELKRELDELMSERQSRYRQSQLERVQSEVPDFDELAGSEAFVNWAYSQPKTVQEIIQRNGTQIVDADETAFVLKAFKRDAGIFESQNDQKASKPKKSSKRVKQIKAATMPGSRVTGQQVGTDFVPDNASDEERWEAMARRRARMRR